MKTGSPNTAQATVLIGTSGWDASRTADFRGGAGPSKWKSARNVLFVPDGFTQGEEATFTKIVGGIVSEMMTNPMTRPYSDLKNSINYWSLFVGSREAGVTQLPEYRTWSSQGKVLGSEIKPGPAPASSTGPLSLDELIYLVGRPVPIDDGASHKTRDQKAKDWDAFLGLAQGTMAARVTDAVYTAWLGLASRTLVDDRDTFFGVARGSRPTVGPVVEPTQLILNERRVRSDYLEALLAKVSHQPKGGPQIPLGQVWTPPDPQNPTAGKDRGLVCIVARELRLAGTDPVDAALYVSIATGGQLNPTETLTSGADGRTGFANSYRQAPTGVALQNAHTGVWLTTAHELGHAFGLGDEYSGRAPSRRHRGASARSAATTTSNSRAS